MSIEVWAIMPAQVVCHNLFGHNLIHLLICLMRQSYVAI